MSTTTKILIAFMLVSTAYAMHLEYLNMDLEEEQHNESLAVGQGEEVPEIHCFVCKKVIKWIKKHLGNTDRPNVIKQKLHKICERIPVPIKDKCKSIISKYIDVLTKEFSTDDDPATICGMINFCKSKSFLEFILETPEVQQIL